MHARTRMRITEYSLFNTHYADVCAYACTLNFKRHARASLACVRVRLHGFACVSGLLHVRECCKGRIHRSNASGTQTRFLFKDFQDVL